MVPIFFLAPLLDAWAIAKVWHWFLEPEYGAAPTRISLIGIAALVRYLTYHEKTVCEHKEKKSPWTVLGEMLSWGVVKQPLLVGFTWLYWKVLL
jgi:ABC-type sugar transport system permease subunit